MKYVEFISEITKREGGKKNLSIAQVKEVVKHTRNVVKEKTGVDIYEIVKTIEFDYTEKKKKCQCVKDK